MSPCSGTPRRASIARVASQPDGRFVVVWSSDGQDGSSLGVLAQLYDPTGAPDGMASTGFGLQGLIDDTTGLYVQDDSPSDEDRYHARFYFDPNGFDPGVGQGHLRMRVFLGSRKRRCGGFSRWWSGARPAASTA